MKQLDFPSPLAAAQQLAADLHEALQHDIATAAGATLTLPGGTTPSLLFEQLSRRALPWEKITVIPSDERQVSADDERSNEGMIARRLLAPLSTRPRFISLRGARREIEARLTAAPAPIPGRVVLGMGTDGHIASLFTPTDCLQPGLITHTLAPDGLPRTSLTLNLLARATSVALLITGHQKAAVLTTVRQTGASLPIGELIRRCELKLTVYWSADPKD